MRNLPPNQGDAQRHTSGCTGLIRLSLCVVAMAILWGIRPAASGKAATGTRLFDLVG